MTSTPGYDLDALAALEAAKELIPTGYPGYYVHANGSVWSASNWRGKGLYRLNTRPDEAGYSRVSLGQGKKRPCIPVHKLICKAFHGERPSPSHEIRHLNGVKEDNRAENLAWGTRSENAKDRAKHGTCRARENGRIGADKSSQTQIAKSLENIAEFERAINALPAMLRDLKDYKWQTKELAEEVHRLGEENDKMREALEQLARLGGVGGEYGNSEGNRIAQAALEKLIGG